MHDRVDGSEVWQRAGKVMGDAAVGRLGPRRAAGKAGNMMPALAQETPDRSAHEPACAFAEPRVS